MSQPEAHDLKSALGRAVHGRVEWDKELSQISRWRIGGKACALVEPNSEEEVLAVTEAMRGRAEPLLVVGETSNLLFDSEGFEGVVMRVGPRMAALARAGTRVVVGAGYSVPKLARASAEFGLTGLEHTVGIPGTIGGLAVMNGGSQRRGVGEVIETVRCVTRDGRALDLAHDDCEFAYRTSALQAREVVVVGVTLRLSRGNRAEIHANMDKIVASRRARFPEDQPNCGSTFLSDPAMYDLIGPPGRAIEDAGLKGFTIGGAQVSPRHANFVVNTGSATSEDVLRVIDHVRRQVSKRTGFHMACEVRYVSPQGKVMPAHVAAEALVA